MRTTERMVRGVAYHPRDWALQRVIGWSMLAAGSVANEWEIVLWAVRDPTGNGDHVHFFIFQWWQWAHGHILSDWFGSEQNS